MSESEGAHLLPIVQPLARESAEERIRRIQKDRWIGYPRAEAALARLEELMHFPHRSRMPNLILVGATNNGKTMLIEKFCRTHCPERLTLEDPPLRMPVLKVQMPLAPEEKRFFAAILDALGVPDRLNERMILRQETAMRLMRAAEVRLLAIDEIHNMLSGTRPQQRRFLNLLRWLGNELEVPIVAAGIVEALRAVQSDDQLANRFSPFALPPWRMGTEYLRLLNTLEAVLPLRRASGLARLALAHWILPASEGALGEIVTLVTSAATRAITCGDEMITVPLLESVDFVPPTERRRAAERLLSG